MKYLFLFLLLLKTQNSFGWGARGHDVICQASVFLLKDKQLKEFFVPRGYFLAHLCLIPDIDWRGLSKEQTEAGNPTHYVNPENAGTDLQSLNSDFKKVFSQVKGKSLAEKHKKIGSNWWRAKQFYEAAISAGKSGKTEEMIHNMGLLGHFTADNGNVFHIRRDYDGKEIGHDGIHEFFETIVPGTFGPELLMDIVREAESLSEIPSEEDIIESMRKLALAVNIDHKKIIETDKPVVRKDPALIAPEWRPLIVKAMAKSVKLHAHLMDKAYTKAGKPSLEKTRPFFPFKLEFVQPDYLPR